jgi:hypothetical protein
VQVFSIDSTIFDTKPIFDALILVLSRGCHALRFLKNRFSAGLLHNCGQTLTTHRDL